MISKTSVLDLKNLSNNNIDQHGLIIENIRDDFNLLIENASLANNNPYWLLSSIVSREAEYSPLFSRCCSLELIKFNITNNSDLKKIVIYDKQLFLLVKKYCNSNRIDLEIELKKESIKPLLYLHVKNFIRSFSLVVLTLIAKLFTKKNTFNKSSSLILLSTHILNDGYKEFTKKGYIDRYYPNLYSYLDKTIEDNIVFVPGFPGGPQSYINLFKKLKLSNINFLLKGDILHVSDYLYAFLSSAKVLFIRTPKTFFRGIEISSLIKSELRFFTFDYKIIEAFLNYRFVYRLNKDKFDISTFIDWYENHLSSKGFMLGFNKFMPNVKTIAYQGIIDSAAYKINLHPTVFERLSMLTPKKFVVIGDGLISHLKEFDNNINVCSGPSFRYNYLWDKMSIKQDLKLFTIFIALPISFDETNSILVLLDKTLSLLTRDSVIKIRVKYHPTYNLSKIQKLIHIKDSRVDFVDGSFVDYIYDSSLLITGASTTCIEAMVIGVPVVVSGSKSGVMNISIPSSIPSDLYKVITNGHDLEKYICSLMARNKINNPNKALIEGYFKRADKDSVALFFKL